MRRLRHWVVEYSYPDSTTSLGAWRIWSPVNSPRWSDGFRPRWTSPYHKSGKFTLAGAFKIATSTKLVYRGRTIRLRNVQTQAIFTIGKLMATDLANTVGSDLKNIIRLA